MSIIRVMPSGWGVNQKLTSGQMSSVDANASYGLDKRAGQSDTLASTVSVIGNISVANGAEVEILSGGVLSNQGGIVQLGASYSLTQFVFPSAGAVTLDCSKGNVFSLGTLALSSPTTITFSNIISGQEVSLTFSQGASLQAVTWLATGGYQCLLASGMSNVGTVNHTLVTKFLATQTA